MNWRNLALGFLLVGLIAAIALRMSVAAAATAKEPPAAPPASTYAPADDLIAQVDYYLGYIEKTLANKDDFDDGAKSRVEKDANTLAVLLLILGQHDTDNRFKPKEHVLSLVPIALKLAAAPDFDTAAARLGDLKKKTSGDNKTSDSVELTKGHVASMNQLMKQVPIINSALKRAVTPQRFKAMQQQSAGQSATLAAIAQAVMADASAVKNPTDLDKWYEYCAEMRTAAGAVNSAIHAEDEAATTAAMSRLAASCETCHKVFRKE